MKIKKAQLSLRIKKERKTFIKYLPLTLLAVPTLIYFIIFKYLPMYGLILPFKNYQASKGFFGSDWVGLENFKFLLHNAQLNKAVINTVLYNLVFIIGGIFFAVLIALMLFEVSRRSVKVYQTVIYLPYYISYVIVAYAALAFLDAENGLFNKIIALFGGSGRLWYNNPGYWPAIIIFTAIWKGAGSDAVLYYAALMGVDKGLFEAAEIDGANKLQIIKNIAIPTIRPIIIMMSILKIGRIFSADFGLFYNLTFDSPLLYSTTDVLDTYINRALLNLGDIGLSSAVGFVQAVLGFILVIATNKIVKKFDDDSALF